MTCLSLSFTIPGVDGIHVSNCAYLPHMGEGGGRGRGWPSHPFTGQNFLNFIVFFPRNSTHVFTAPIYLRCILLRSRLHVFTGPVYLACILLSSRLHVFTGPVYLACILLRSRLHVFDMHFRRLTRCSFPSRGAPYVTIITINKFKEN